jgi:PAS domain S-box-containing protein
MKIHLKSIRSKLILLVVLSSGLAGLLVGGALVARQSSLLIDLAENHLRTQADLIALQSAATLAFDDPKAATQTLEALRALREISSAAIYNSNGKLFASYARPAEKDRTPPAFDPLIPGQRRAGDWLVLGGKPIMAAGDSPERLGTLAMVYDLAPIFERTYSSALISLLLGAGATFVALAAGMLINRLLARPLGELGRTARHVSLTRNYAVRATKYGDDELGQLTEAFNEMLDQVGNKEAALLRAQERFRTAIEAAPNAMVIADAAGRIVMVNARAEEFFRYPREELVGMHVDELVPRRYRSGHTGFREAFARSPGARPLGARRELFGLRKDGSEFPIEIGLNTVQTDEGTMMMATVVDITERKRAERERERLLESERTARTEAEHASQMKDEFVATLSHELRSPLTAITGWAYMLRRLVATSAANSHGAAERAGDGADGQPPRPPAEDQLAKGLEVIERNARVQTQLIEDLLDMSRIVSGKIRLDVQEVDLPEVIEQALTTAEPAARAREIRLQKLIDPRVAPIHGDPARLQQIIWNLLSNAIKFTPRKGRVQVILQRINSHIEIVVSDTGEGIDPAFLPHIFERFRQADASTTRKHGGLGLGLAIVKHLVELHGGTVSASSDGLGKGATFTVVLPLAIIHPRPQEERVHPRAPTAETVAETAADDSALSGVRVVVAEDDADARDLIGRVLEQAGARVRSAGSANEALAAMEEFRPAVLVSDIGMPGKDGYQLIREVRARAAERGGLVPAIALTAFARSEDRTRALLAGYQMHLAKPVNPEELVASVASLAGLAPRRES